MDTSLSFRGLAGQVRCARQNSKLNSDASALDGTGVAVLGDTITLTVLCQPMVTFGFNLGVSSQMMFLRTLSEQPCKAVHNMQLDILWNSLIFYFFFFFFFNKLFYSILLFLE